MSDNPIPAQEPLRRLYCALMEELKRRRDIIYRIATFKLPGEISIELCFLQLRMICELIALGCLAAHGDIPATKTGKMRKEYKPDAILNELERLHPSFYPVPGRQILSPDGKPIKVQGVTDPHLTRSELLTLWIECGKHLHRGSMKNIDRPFVVDFNQISEWDRKIATLLNHHQIQLQDDRYMLWVMMNEKTTGNVVAHLMLKIGPALDPAPDQT
jgi:hypothetical protein